MCARTARRGLTARVSAASPTRWTHERIARETLAHPLLPKAFKRAGADSGPDEQHQLLSLWNNRRRSILTSRQHLVGEAEHLLCELPLELREQLPDTKAVRPRLAALAAPQPPPPLRPADAAAAAAARRLPRSRSQALDREEQAGRRAAGRRSSARAARRSASSAACAPARSPSCWSRSATPAGSPRAASPLQRLSAVARLDRRGTRRAAPPPLQPRRQPAHQRDPAPDGGHPAALRAARPAHLRQRPRQRAHQEGGPPHPQAPPLRRHLPPHDP